MQLSNPHKIIISGGGTGGHIFPAIAIAKALQKTEPDIELLFVGAVGKMEMEKIPAAGFKIEGLNIAGIKRELSIQNLKWPFKLMSSLMKAGKIIDRFQPDAAVGVGGYASGPLLYIASGRKIPSLIQEQNSYPGITNKLLAKKVQKICVAYDKMDRFFPADKIIKTGNPVRADILIANSKKQEAALFFNLHEEKKTLLIVGGSQGARTINRSVLNDLSKLTDAGLQVIWQTGKVFFDQAKAAVDELKNPAIIVFEFITRMDLAYAMSDIVIARGGASSVSELCIVGKPVILVPLPTAAEDHQTKNCMALVERNAALMVKDADAQQLLIQNALDLFADKEKQKTMKENISKLAITDAADRIAAEIISMINK